MTPLPISTRQETRQETRQNRAIWALLLLSLALTPATGRAETAHGQGHAHAEAHGHAPSGQHGGAMAQTPTEPGQGAFAAIAEIVRLLEADPETDWSRVDIDALRAHLVDMNLLALHAEPKSEPTASGLRIALPLTGPAGGAVRRMATAHADVLTAETGWSSVVEQDGETLVWTVEDPSGQDAARIRALGFFGLMATGDHHRQHHLAIAKGLPAH